MKERIVWALGAGAVVAVITLIINSAKEPEKEWVDITPEVEAYYKEHGDFFQVKTPDDIPDNLEWKDGSEHESFASPDAKQGGTLNYFMSDFPRTLRFVGPEANGAFRGYMLDDNVVALVHRHPNAEFGFYPGLAKSWAISDDGKTAYYKLDPDARYSDGEPVKAKDFFFAFYFMRSKHINAPWYNDYFGKEKFTSIAIYDEDTISISYYKAKPDLLDKISIRPVPFHFYQKHGLDEDYVKEYNWRFEPTTGAYEVLEDNVKKGKSVTLTRVEDWWANDKKFFKNRFNPSKVRITVYRDPTVAFEAFRKGDVDWHPLNLPEFWNKKLPNDDELIQKGYIHKVKFFNDVPRPTWALRLNASRPLLNNRDIRIGLQYAINFQLVIDEVLNGEVDKVERMRTVADGYGPRSHPTLVAREFSVEKAQEHFAKAGFNERGTDGILKNADGHRLSFTLTTGYKRLKDVPTVLKNEAKKAGVEINIEILEMTLAWKKAAEKKHDISLAALNVSPEMYPRFWEPYHSDNAYKEEGDSKFKEDGSLKDDLNLKPNTNNTTVTADKELDALINQYRESENLEEITRLAHEIAEKLHAHAAYIPGWAKPWYRLGHWRWVRYPEDFNVRLSRDPEEYNVHWIDVEMKKKTQTAKKDGTMFDPQILVFDKFRSK